MRGPGRQLGVANLKSEGKWRCATCKQANEAEAESCVRCKDPKKVLIEKKVPERSQSGPLNQAPMRFTTCKKYDPKPQI